MHYTFYPQGVCSVQIDFEINDDIVTDISFKGGCNGNLKALSRVVNGKTAEEISELLSGISCGYKETSCSDQLARAVLEASELE